MAVDDLGDGLGQLVVAIDPVALSVDAVVVYRRENAKMEVPANSPGYLRSRP